MGGGHSNEKVTRSMDQNDGTGMKKRDEMGTLPVFELIGPRQEMGRAHGEEFADIIVDLVGARTESIFSTFPSLSSDQLEDYCKTAMDVVKRFTPRVFEEVSATAESSGVDSWQLIISGGYTDLIDVIRANLDGGKEIDQSECTTFVDPVSGTISGTWDSNVEALNAAVLFRRKPADSAITSICLTPAGWPAQQGINSAGIAFAINNLMPARARIDGLNYIAANAYLAEVESIESFLRFARTVKFSGGHAYLIVDDRNRAAVVETTASKVSVNWVDAGFVQTNHYISEPLIDDNSKYPFLHGSVDRKQEMEGLSNGLLVHRERISTALLGTEFVNKSDPNGFVMTCAVYIADGKNRTFHVSLGPSNGEALSTFRL